jgi:hypothetical protein
VSWIPKSAPSPPSRSDCRRGVSIYAACTAKTQAAVWPRLPAYCGHDEIHTRRRWTSEYVVACGGQSPRSASNNYRNCGRCHEFTPPQAVRKLACRLYVANNFPPYNLYSSSWIMCPHERSTLTQKQTFAADIITFNPSAHSLVGTSSRNGAALQVTTLWHVQSSVRPSVACTPFYLLKLTSP